MAASEMLVPSGILENYGAYQRWNRTMSVRVQFYKSTLEMCGVVEDPDSSSAGVHRECRPSEIAKMENAVQRVQTAILNFSNSFNLSDKDKLYSISSGAPVSQEAKDDILRAERVGNEAKEHSCKNDCRGQILTRISLTALRNLGFWPWFQTTKKSNSPQVRER